jgi:predicted ribosome quality control (RQC) complex YloA/Tae2 family protein
MPGSHTLLRLPPGREPSEQDVQYAADLAAWFSKGRKEGKAPVIVTRAANLKKPKGAKPGQVLVTKDEQMVVARPASSAAALAGERDD